MKKVVSCLLSLCLLLSGLILMTFAQGESAETADPNASYYDGTVDTTWYDAKTDGQTEFVLHSAAQLAGLAKLVNDGTETFRDKTVKLGCDIVWNPGTVSFNSSNVITYNAKNGESPKAWIPIGVNDSDAEADNKSFQGIFDGQYHVLSGLLFDNYQKNGGGLFNAFRGKELKNLSIVNSGFTGKSGTGVFAEAVRSGGNDTVLLENLYSDCLVRSVNKYARAAGIVGGICPAEGKTVNVNHCWSASTVYGSDGYQSATGFVGMIKGDAANTSSYVNINNCMVSGKVYCVSERGGLAPLTIHVANVTLTVSNTVSTATVQTGNSDSTGPYSGAGFVLLPNDSNYSISFINCYYSRLKAKNQAANGYFEPVFEKKTPSGVAESDIKDLSEGTVTPSFEGDNAKHWIVNGTNATLTRPTFTAPTNIYIRGAQTTAVNAETNTYSIRFVAEIDGLSYASAGFEVYVSYVDAEGNVTTSEWKRDLLTTTNAYTSVLAAGDPVTPEAEGHYLIAQVVENIAVSDEVKTVVFHLVPYTAAENGTRSYGIGKTFTVTNGAIQ